MSQSIPSVPSAWYRQHPDVLFTELDPTESVLLGLRAQRYYTLNESGACLWKALGVGATPNQLSQALEGDYDVDHGQALACARAFVEELLEEGLIQETPRPR